MIGIRARHPPYSCHGSGRLSYGDLREDRQSGGDERGRRFCVRAWYWNIIRTKDLWMLTDAGYPTGVVFQILAHIAGRRAAQVIAAIPAAPNAISEGKKGSKPNGENSTIPAQRVPHNYQTKAFRSDLAMRCQL